VSVSLKLLHNSN